MEEVVKKSAMELIKVHDMSANENSKITQNELGAALNQGDIEEDCTRENMCENTTSVECSDVNPQEDAANNVNFNDDISYNISSDSECESTAETTRTEDTAHTAETDFGYDITENFRHFVTNGDISANERIQELEELGIGRSTTESSERINDSPYLDSAEAFFDVNVDDNIENFDVFGDILKHDNCTQNDDEHKNVDKCNNFEVYEEQNIEKNEYQNEENVDTDMESYKSAKSGEASSPAISSHTTDEEEDDHLCELIARNSSKKSKRISTMSVASSIAALLPFIRTSKDEQDNADNDNSDMRDPKNSNAFGKNGNRGLSRSWMSASSQRIGLLMQQAAEAAKENRQAGFTTEAVAEWSSLLDKSFDSCLGNSERFILEIPQNLNFETQLVEKTKQSTLKKLSRKSRMFFHGRSASFGSSFSAKSRSTLSKDMHWYKNKNKADTEDSVISSQSDTKNCGTILEESVTGEMTSLSSQGTQLKSIQSVPTLDNDAETSIESEFSMQTYKSIFGISKSINVKRQKEHSKWSKFNKFLHAFKTKEIVSSDDLNRKYSHQVVDITV